jgi:L-ornithine N5-oxygenase
MTPHADFDLARPTEASSHTDGYSNGIDTDFLLDKFEKGNRSLLQPTDENELHDLVCAGFGPASLAIAIALHDSLEKEGYEISEEGPKVAFLEMQSQFAWHAGMLLEGARMQISFIKDMATLRNPRSCFSFLNYLHQKNRLVQFSNLDTFLPLRIEFEDYLRWCAEWFDDVAHYNQEVLEVRPEKSWKGNQQIDSFAVVSRNTRTGAISTRRGKHVVVAAGGRPKIPRAFPERHPRLLHSSQFAYRISDLLPERNAPYKIAVIGGGQSAAEIFNNLHDRYPKSQTRLILKGAAMKPSDDSPL